MFHNQSLVTITIIMVRICIAHFTFEYDHDQMRSSVCRVLNTAVCFLILLKGLIFGMKLVIKLNPTLLY